MNALLDAVIRGSIRRRHLVLLCAAAVTLAGLWLAQSARLDALPGFTPPLVGLQSASYFVPPSLLSASQIVLAAFSRSSGSLLFGGALAVWSRWATRLYRL